MTKTSGESIGAHNKQRRVGWERRRWERRRWVWREGGDDTNSLHCFTTSEGRCRKAMLGVSCRRPGRGVGGHGKVEDGGGGGRGDDKETGRRRIREEQGDQSACPLRAFSASGLN